MKFIDTMIFKQNNFINYLFLNQLLNSFKLEIKGMLLENYSYSFFFNKYIKKCK